MTPEALIKAFDMNAMLIMLAWGVLHTRLPMLAKVPNTLVPWVNAVAYILAKFLVPEAHASVGSSLVHQLGLLGTVAYSGALSALTSLFYDKFLKVPLDLIVPKAVPAR